MCVCVCTFTDTHARSFARRPKIAAALSAGSAAAQRKKELLRRFDALPAADRHALLQRATRYYADKAARAQTSGVVEMAVVDDE